MKKKILLVDDSALLRKRLRKSLEANSIEVVEAGNGNQGLEVVRSQSCDLMIVDLHMPGMSGLEFIEALNDDQETHTPPFMFHTAECEPAEINKGRALGAKAWVLKPCNHTQLVSSILKVLGA